MGPGRGSGAMGLGLGGSVLELEATQERAGAGRGPRGRGEGGATGRTRAHQRPKACCPIQTFSLLGSWLKWLKKEVLGNARKGRKITCKVVVRLRFIRFLSRGRILRRRRVMTFELTT